MENYKQFGPRIREDVMEKMREHCKRERISMSALTEIALRKYLSDKEQGDERRD